MAAWLLKLLIAEYLVIACAYAWQRDWALILAERQHVNLKLPLTLPAPQPERAAQVQRVGLVEATPSGSI